MRPPPANPLIVALDRPDLVEAEALAASLVGVAGHLKVGLELLAAHGPEAVRRIREIGSVFLDAKLHDIPSTVHAAAKAGRRTRRLRERAVSRKKRQP